MNRYAMRTFVLCFVLGSPCIFGKVEAQDHYWISYVSANPKTAPCCLPGGARYLMQIDPLGNIIIPPQKVVTVGQVTSDPGSPTAIARRGSRTISMWLINRRAEVMRVTVDKQTLSVQEVKNTGKTVANKEHLQVSQKTDCNFLVTDLDAAGNDIVPTILAISASGKFTGETSPLLRGGLAFECFDATNCGSSISADGRMGVLAYGTIASGWRLLLQPITDTGKAKRTPVEIFSSRRVRIRSADITANLSGGRRFLVYVQQALHSTSMKESIYLQVVNAITGERIGDRLRIGNPITFGQSVAIDPLGRFVLYSVGTSESDSLGLAFQALDATGHASGSPKIIATKVESGVDILLDLE